MGEKRVVPRQRRRTRQAVCLLGSCVILYCLLFVFTSGSGDSTHFPSGTLHKQRLTPELLSDLSLTEQQCNTAFPGLAWSIDDVVALGPFELQHRGEAGPLIGRIQDGKINVLLAQRNADLSKEMINSRTAALHQLHRALLTSPEPIPDTVFALNFQDQPFGSAWAYSRSSFPPDLTRHPDDRAFLMPHFSFWAWNLPFVGSVSRALAAVSAIEAAHPSLADKIPRAVWRGTSWFNSVHNPRLRANLLAATRDRPWADAEELRWDTGTRNASNALPIEDFCRYRYVLHTEGVTYSGRFQFLQMCASVVLTPPIGWMQHTTHLVRPVFSTALLDRDRDRASRKASGAKAGGVSGGDDGRAGGSGTDAARERWNPSERVRKAWPVQYAPEEANIVFVAPDWSDLEETVMWLETHPKVAQGIARRQRDLFVGGGYFSPAAEACYWRALVRGWSKVVKTEGEQWQNLGPGESFEAFSVTNGH